MARDSEQGARVAGTADGEPGRPGTGSQDIRHHGTRSQGTGIADRVARVAGTTDMEPGKPALRTGSRGSQYSGQGSQGSQGSQGCISRYRSERVDSQCRSHSSATTPVTFTTTKKPRLPDRSMNRHSFSGVMRHLQMP